MIFHCLLIVDSSMCYSLPSVTRPLQQGLFIMELIFNSNMSEDHIHNVIHSRLSFLCI